MATGANNTPLGRTNPSMGSGRKPQGGNSLLKPNYISTEDSYGYGQQSNDYSAYSYDQKNDYGGYEQKNDFGSYDDGSSHNTAGMSYGQASYSTVSYSTGGYGSGNGSQGNMGKGQYGGHGGMMKREFESGNDSDSNSASDRKKKRKSRWGEEEKRAFVPGMPTIIPPNLSRDQQEAYLVQLQIEEISRRLRTGDLGIPTNPEERSPSPEPIYGTDGKRLNTREYRTRRRLEEERHELVQRMQKLVPDYKPPMDYRPPTGRVFDKVMIPQDEHPDINFVGLLIGPRGNTLKMMEKDTGAKIIIRGKGSIKEGKVARKDGQPLPGEDEPLHAYVTAFTMEAVKKACEKVREVIRQGIEVPEGQNDLRRMQLRELAMLNGTLRETDGPRCNNCGATNHKAWQCPDRPNVTNNVICNNCGGAGHIARDCRQSQGNFGGPPGSEQNKIDEEYMSLMAELGEGPPPAPGSGPPATGGNRRFGGGPSMFERSQGPRAAIMPGPGMMGGPPPQGMGMMNRPPWGGPPMGNNPPPPGLSAGPPPAPGTTQAPMPGVPGGAGMPGMWPGYMMAAPPPPPPGVPGVPGAPGDQAPPQPYPKPSGGSWQPRGPVAAAPPMGGYWGAPPPVPAPGTENSGLPNLLVAPPPPPPAEGY